MIPQFSGAAYVYEHYVRPYLVTRQKSVNIWYVPRKKDFFSKPDDVLTAAEKYIQEHGSEAFENMIRKVCDFGTFALDLSFNIKGKLPKETFKDCPNYTLLPKLLKICLIGE